MGTVDNEIFGPGRFKLLPEFEGIREYFSRPRVSHSRYYYTINVGDYLEFTFKNAKLVSWNDIPCGELGENLPLFEGTWEYTDLQVKYLPCDSAGTNKPDEDADYELA